MELSRNPPQLPSQGQIAGLSVPFQEASGHQASAQVPGPETTLSPRPTTPAPFLQGLEQEPWGRVLGEGRAYFQVVGPPVSGRRMDFDQEQGDIWQKLLMRD